MNGISKERLHSKIHCLHNVSIYCPLQNRVRTERKTPRKREPSPASGWEIVRGRQGSETKAGMLRLAGQMSSSGTQRGKPKALLCYADRPEERGLRFLEKGEAAGVLFQWNRSLIPAVWSWNRQTPPPIVICRSRQFKN